MRLFKVVGGIFLIVLIINVAFYGMDYLEEIAYINDMHDNYGVNLSHEEARNCIDDAKDLEDMRGYMNKKG